MVDAKNSCRILMGKVIGKEELEISRKMDNFKVDLK